MFTVAHGPLVAVPQSAMRHSATVARTMHAPFRAARRIPAGSRTLRSGSTWGPPLKAGRRQVPAHKGAAWSSNTYTRPENKQINKKLRMKLEGNSWLGVGRRRQRMMRPIVRPDVGCQDNVPPRSLAGRVSTQMVVLWPRLGRCHRGVVPRDAGDDGRGALSPCAGVVPSVLPAVVAYSVAIWVKAPSALRSACSASPPRIRARWPRQKARGVVFLSTRARPRVARA